MSAFLLRRLALLMVLAATAAFWIQPIAAFDRAALGERDVAASVVAQSSAYDALTGGSCANMPPAGGSCQITITNKGTTALAYSVTLTSDPDGIVLSYRVGDSPWVSSGETTSSSVAVGGTATLTASLVACGSCSGASRTIHWMIRGSNAGVLDTMHTRVPMTITFL